MKNKFSLLNYLLLLITLMFGLLGIPISSSLTREKRIMTSGIIEFLSPLHVEGNQLVDDRGNIVYLRGVVKGVCSDIVPGGNWPYEGGGEDSGWNNWNPERIRWHLRNMKNFGFNVWRCFGWNLRMWKFKDTDPNAALAVQHMIEAIEIAYQERLYVVVAPYGVSNQRAIEGDDRETLPIPPYIGTQQGQETITSEQDFIDIWVDIANTLKGYPNVLFELYNEPDYPKWGNFNRTQVEADWFRVVQQTINAIREISDRPIIVQWRACLWYNDWIPEPEQTANLKWVYKWNLTGTNIVISAHLYRAYGSLGGNDGSPVPYIYEDVKARLEFLLQDVYLYYPVYIGEIGCDISKTGTGLEEEFEAFNNTLRVFSEWGISYTVFTWKSTGMFAIFETQPWLPPLNEAGQILVNATKQS